MIGKGVKRALTSRSVKESSLTKALMKWTWKWLREIANLHSRTRFYLQKTNCCKDGRHESKIYLEPMAKVLSTSQFHRMLVSWGDRISHYLLFRVCWWWRFHSAGNVFQVGNCCAGVALFCVLWCSFSRPGALLTRRPHPHPRPRC